MISCITRLDLNLLLHIYEKMINGDFRAFSIMNSFGNF
jgi:hypothetical protein